MNAGLYWSCDRWELSVAATAAFVDTNSGNGAELCGGYAESSYQSGAAATTSGFKISAQSRYKRLSGGVPECEYALSIGGVVVHTTVASGWESAPTARLELDDVRVYVRILAGVYVWEIRWSALRFYAQSSMVYSSGAALHYGPLALLTPASIPLIGIPPRVGAAASLSLQPAEDGAAIPGFGVFENSVTAAVTSGGFRWKVGSTWFAPAVTLSVEAVPSAGCSLAAPSVACTASNAGTCEAWARWQQPTANTREWDVAASSFVPIPQYSRSVARLGPDYAALVYRGGQPKAERTATIVCDVYTGGTSTTATAELSPARSEFLANVGSAPHSIEDNFSDPVYGGYSFARTLYLSDTLGLTDSTSVSGGAPVVNQPSDVLPYLLVGSGAYEAQLARYVNTVCSPHWSYFLWFPPDVADGDLQPYEWPVFGERANPSLYWFWIRQQWAYHPSLPGGENTLRRQDVMLEPMQDGQLFGYVSAVLGIDSHWWGVSRFQADRFEPPATLEIGTAARWSAVDASLSVGSSVAVTLGPGKSSAVVDVDLMAFGTAPWFAAAVAESFEVDWSGFSSVSVSLVGWDGSEVSLGSTPDTYDWPGGLDSQWYAGSWARDFGFPQFAGQDTGIDTHADGRSAAWMLDPERVAAFQLLPHRNAKTLRFEVATASPGGSGTIELPVLHLVSDRPYVVPETAQTCALLWPDGPGVRFGCWQWPMAEPMVPLPADAYRSPTVWDYLCWRRAAVEGIDPLSGVDAEIANRYDAVEGQSRSLVAAGTLASIVRQDAEASAVLINSLAECPPALMCPRFDRDDELVETGTTPILKTWSYCCQRRFLVSQASEAEQADPGGTPITADSALISVDGWHVHDHALALDNEEGPTYPIGWDGERRALASPWHGYFCATGASDVGGSPTYDVSLTQVHARLIALDGVNVSGSVGLSNSVPVAFGDVPQKISGAWVRLCWDSRGPLQRRLAVTEDAGDVALWWSGSEGEWTMAISVGSGSYPCVCVDPFGGTIYVYWCSGGGIQGAIYDPEFNLLAGPFEAVATADEGGIDAAVSVGANGAVRVGLIYSVSGVVTMDWSETGFSS